MKAACTIVAVVCAGLSGCMSGGAYKGQTLFTIEAGATDAAAQSSKPHSGTLRVRSVTVAQPYSNVEFVYQYADGRMRTDPYGGLIAAPGALMTVALVDRIGREKVFETVVSPDLVSIEAYELAVSVFEFGAVFDDKGGNARIRGTAFLMDPTAQPNAVLGTYTVEASAPTNGQDVTAVAEALNAAFANWAGRLSQSLRAADVPMLSARAAARKAAQ